MSIVFITFTGCQTFKPYNDEVSFIFVSNNTSQNAFGFLEDGTFKLLEDGKEYYGRWGKNSNNIQLLYQDNIRNGKKELIVMQYNRFKYNNETYKKLNNKATEIFMQNYK